MKIEEIMSESMRTRLNRAIEKRRGVVRTAVQAVCQGYTTALFIHGPGGLGKTHLVTEELECLNAKAWKHHTAYATPKSLMLTLAEHPDCVHLFEDCEKMYKTDVSASILRAACGSPRGKDRIVTYETAHEKFAVKFRGGIIIVSNENLGRAKGPLAAVASRFRPIKWDMSMQERIACILDIADKGWERNGRRLDPSECRRVAKFLIEEMVGGATDTPVDLRTFTEHALPAFAQWAEENSPSNWHDVIRAKLQGEVRQAESRDTKNDRLETLALTIDGKAEMKTPEKVALWKSETGLGQAQYFRHLRSAKSKKPPQ